MRTLQYNITHKKKLVKKSEKTITRSLMRMASLTPKVILHVPKNVLQPTGRMSSRIAVNVEKSISNDGNGQHTHLANQTCILKKCDTTKCPFGTLCDKRQKLTLLGHQTHRPPVGRIATFVDDHDVKGDKRPQYYVKPNEKKEYTEQEIAANKIKIKPAKSDQQKYFENHDDKYH